MLSSLRCYAYCFSGYRFLYGAQKSAFGGRTKELGELQSFLADETPFCWWMVLGEAGLGKSRLALEICLRIFGWRAGFLPSSYSIDEFKNWVPNQPTLIIADYAAFRAKDIGTIIRVLKTHANCRRLPFPVRLLLLERSRRRYYENEKYYADVLDERWFQTLEGVGHDQELTHSAWYARGKKLMMLEPLPPDHTWKIVCAFGKGKTREEQRGEILNWLKEEVDRPLSRPLYAAMLGDAIAAGRNYRQLATFAILKDVLQREEERFWQPAWQQAEVMKEDQERDKDVLALTTMAGEIDLGAENVPLPTALEDMLNAESFSFERYGLMSAGSTDRLLKPLVPDILGEAFVLEHLKPANPRQTRRCDRLRDIAWSLNRENMESFLSRVDEDFPDHPTLKCLW